MSAVRDGARALVAALMLTLCVLAGSAMWAARASAETPSSTDVMLVFDTSGSMSSELAEAKGEIQQLEAQVRASLPNVQFAVSEVKDYANAYFNGPNEKPWKLDQAMTSNAALIKAAIEPLNAEGGGDGPEAYGRALWESDTNPDVGWRPGARHVIVLVADNVPHDNNLDEGIPESQWAPEGKPAPWNTGEELPGTQGIAGSVWATGDSTDFQTTLGKLATDGKPLGMVDFHGVEFGYLPYWEYWAALTGGKAVLGGAGELVGKVTGIIKETANNSLPPCPAGQARSGEGVCFTLHPTGTQVICNLIIATATDECTASVGDGAPSGSTNPSGTVSFASASGGSFPLGNVCTLKPTLPGNTSSCTVQFLPPTAPSTFPAITATYGGDATHSGSSGHTAYGGLGELSGHLALGNEGTLNGNQVEVPVSCQFNCSVNGSLSAPGNGSGGPNLSTSLLPSVPATGGPLGAWAAKHNKKKKKPAPVLIGTGHVTVKAGGKTVLVIALTSKARKAIAKAHPKRFHATLKVTIVTASGVLVTQRSRTITIRPKPKSKHHKH